MRRPLLNALKWAAIGSIAAVAAAVARPGDRELVLDAYVLFTAALALRVLVQATRLAAPAEASSRFEEALRTPARRSARPDDLLALERTLLLARETAIDWHVRLRPLLQEIAEHRLTTRLGIGLAAPEAEQALGDAWPLVRPDAAPPGERFEKGVAHDELRAAVAALERI